MRIVLWPPELNFSSFCNPALVSGHTLTHDFFNEMFDFKNLLIILKKVYRGVAT